MKKYSIELTKEQIYDLVTAINYGVCLCSDKHYYATADSFYKMRSLIFNQLNISSLGDLTDYD